MTKIKLSLPSGVTHERELITSFINNNIKYLIFDGESTGSMGLPIILVSKEKNNRVVGITDAEEWKATKDCLKKIIAGDAVDYASVSNELSADDIYYRQLTLPIASFDILKSSYKAPVNDNVTSSNEISEDKPIFEPITPEEVSNNVSIPSESVSPNAFTNESVLNNSLVQPSEVPNDNSFVSTFNTETSKFEDQQIKESYDDLKREFLKASENLFDNIFQKFNHKD